MSMTATQVLDTGICAALYCVDDASQALFDLGLDTEAEEVVVLGERIEAILEAAQTARQPAHTIKGEDVGKRWLRIDGRMRENPLGVTLQGDVGKRVYDVDGVLQVENDGQLATRARRAYPLKDGREVVVEGTNQKLVIGANPKGHDYPGFLYVQCGQFTHLEGETHDGEHFAAGGTVYLCDSR